MRDAEPKPGKSELLRDMLEAGKAGSQSAGVNTRMRAMVTEVTRVSPLKLANSMSAVALKTATELCYRSAEYILRRIETHSGLSADDRAAVDRETTELFGEFLSELKTEIVKEFVAVEDFIFSKTFVVDPELFSAGFVRFAHQENLDFTRLDEASALEEKVDALELEVETKLREAQQLRQEIEDIEQVLPRIEELLFWLDTVLSSDIDVLAPKVRVLAHEVENGIKELQANLP